VGQGESECIGGVILRGDEMGERHVFVCDSCGKEGGIGLGVPLGLPFGWISIKECGITDHRYLACTPEICGVDIIISLQEAAKKLRTIVEGFERVDNC